MRAITALIAEDEVALRDELRARLKSLWPELDIVAVASNGIEALQLIERFQPDLVFLDIEMPGLTGLEVARECDRRCHVVFITAYDVHAVAAFEQGAIDYVLKPYELARLAAMVRRVKERVGSAAPSLNSVLRELSGAPKAKPHLRWINASQGREVRLITVDEVCYFQSDAKYTRVVMADWETLIRRSLKELQEELDPACFWPIHRSTIVNASAIAGVSRNLTGRVALKLKTRREQLPVSPAHEHLFRQM